MQSFPVHLPTTNKDMNHNMKLLKAFRSSKLKIRHDWDIRSKGFEHLDLWFGGSQTHLCMQGCRGCSFQPYLFCSQCMTSGLIINNDLNSSGGFCLCFHFPCLDQLKEAQSILIQLYVSIDSMTRTIRASSARSGSGISWQRMVLSWTPTNWKSCWPSLMETLMEKSATKTLSTW